MPYFIIYTCYNLTGKRVLFNIVKQNFNRLRSGLLGFNAHGGFSPNGRWMVTDAYHWKSGYNYYRSFKKGETSQSITGKWELG